MHELSDLNKESISGNFLWLALLAPSTQKQNINMIKRSFERNRARARRYKLVEIDYLFCSNSDQGLTESAVQSLPSG